MVSSLGEGLRKVWLQVDWPMIEKMLNEAAEVPITTADNERAAYERMKQAWYFHNSSWWYREVNGYDGYGCTDTACILDCPYFPATGRLKW